MKTLENFFNDRNLESKNIRERKAEVYMLKKENRLERRQKSFGEKLQKESLGKD